MLLYLSGPAFPVRLTPHKRSLPGTSSDLYLSRSLFRLCAQAKDFVILASPDDTVARTKANILHVFYEMNRWG